MDPGQRAGLNQLSEGLEVWTQGTIAIETAGFLSDPFVSDLDAPPREQRPAIFDALGRTHELGRDHTLEAGHSATRFAGSG